MLKNKKVIISIIVFIAILIFCKPAYAMSQEDAGKTIADFAINFYKHYGNKCGWADPGREITYKGQTVNGLYAFDCVGWISFAVHQSLQIGGEEFTYFAVPPGTWNGVRNNPMFDNGFECIKGDITNEYYVIPRDEVLKTVKPGDILFCSDGGPHVVLYVGDGNIIHSYSGDHLNCDPIYDNTTHYTNYCAIGRITESTAKNIDKSNVTTSFIGEGYSESAFEYSGLSKGTYAGNGTDLSWLFDAILGFIDYLIGIIFYVFRAPFVGWANIIEVTINDTINNLSGVEVTGETVTITKNEDSRKYTRKQSKSS